MTLYIEGIGTAVPPHVVTQNHAALLARQFCSQADQHQEVITKLYEHSGVKRRHSVVLASSSNSMPPRQSFFTPARGPADRGPTTAARMRKYQTAADVLAVAAAQDALAHARIEADRVTHLVTVSCTGFHAPGFDLALLRALPLAATTARTHIGFMGCHAALNGLRVAGAFANADADACVLIVAVEICTVHQHYGSRRDRIVANALFGDGAAAIVACGKPRRDVATHAISQLIDSGSTVIEDSKQLMRWDIGDHGFEMSLSPRIPDLIRRHLRPWLDQWLARHELSVGRIGSWAIHPGGPRILDACGDAVGLSAEQLAASRRILADYGNMSSPTVLFILDHLRARNAAPPTVLLGFGPGVTVEAALLG